MEQARHGRRALGALGIALMLVQGGAGCTARNPDFAAASDGGGGASAPGPGDAGAGPGGNAQPDLRSPTSPTSPPDLAQVPDPSPPDLTMSPPPVDLATPPPPVDLATPPPPAPDLLEPDEPSPDLAKPPMNACAQVACNGNGQCKMAGCGDCNKKSGYCDDKKGGGGGGGGNDVASGGAATAR